MLKGYLESKFRTMTYKRKGEVVEPCCEFDRKCESCTKHLQEIGDNSTIRLKTKQGIIEVLLNDENLIIDKK